MANPDAEEKKKRSETRKEKPTGTIQKIRGEKKGFYFRGMLNL